MKLALILAVAWAIAPLSVAFAEAAAASVAKSSFGFEVSLPAGWVHMGPQESSRKVPTVTELGNANKKELEAIGQRVKSGQVEFFFDALLSTESFTNNITLQLEEGESDYSQYSSEGIQAFCKTLPPDLSTMWGEPVSFKGCEVVSSNGSRVLAYSYVVPSQQKFILQYVIPFNKEKTMVLVGGGHLDKDVILRMQTAIKAIATAITGRKK